MSLGIPEVDEIHEIEEPKTARISVSLLLKRHLPPNVDTSKLSQEKMLDAIHKITHVRLDRENIGSIDGLEVLGPDVTNLYLQQNCIKIIENLECLQKLRFLTLSGNKITRIEGLNHLPKLSFLDLSENLIRSFDIDELPQTLIILSLKDNPCTSMQDYRGRIIQDLPNLRTLDDEEVSKEERMEAGYKVSSDSEDEEDEEEDSDEEEEDLAHGRGDGKTDYQLHERLQQMASDMLVRSQDRLEATLEDHKSKISQLDDIRVHHSLPPSARYPATARNQQH